MATRYGFIFFVWIFICPLISMAQEQRTRWEIVQVDSSNTNKYNRYFKKKDFFDSKEDVLKGIRSLSDKCLSNGFLSFSIDSTVFSEYSATSYLFLGENYRWGKISSTQIEAEIIERSGLQPQKWKNKIISPQKMNALFNSLLNWCENNGYPFAEVKLDSLKVIENCISGVLVLNKNEMIRFDSIVVKGKPIVNDNYLHSTLGIKEGDLYRQKEVALIEKRLKELPFIEETEPYTIDYSSSKTKLTLFLKRKKASQINGILGFLPDDAGKLTFTGEAKIKLVNSLKRGESVEFNWRSLQKNTQDLKGVFSMPYLLNTPFGIEALIKFYKKDTLFSEVNQRLGFLYMLGRNNYLKAYGGQNLSTVQSSSVYGAMEKLPEMMSLSTLQYGINFKKQELDYTLNPRRGFSLDVSLGAGKRKIKSQPGVVINNLDSLNKLNQVYHAEVDADIYIPVFSKTTINIGNQTLWRESPLIFTNELYRFGGLKTMRGFNEETLFASFYSVFSAEWRYLFEENSNAYLFFDAAYYEDKSGGKFKSDTPMSFGGGVNFETKAGIFSLNYALGKQLNNPFLLQTGKIHFGFVNYF